MKKAILAGTTGLVGSILLPKLLESAAYQEVISIARKPISITHHKLRQEIVDFRNLNQKPSIFRADDAFCCLGTTRKKSGKEGFYEVDFTFTYQFAKICAEQGVKRFFLVSAIGADEQSMFYYNQVKGKVENEISRLPFEAFHIFRPSLLLGDRNEKRIGEDIGKIFYQVFNFLIPLKYKGIEAEKVAAMMLQTSLENQQGKFIYESDLMQKSV